MVVLEADHPLGDQEHQYYNDLVTRLKNDKEHVQYAMDLWGSPVTAAGAQSIDGKATYLLLRLAGNVGQIQANESVDSVRDIIKNDPPPQGLKVYVSGSAPMASDTLSIANNSLNNITIVTIILILVMLLAGLPLADQRGRADVQRAVRNPHRQGHRVDPRALRVHPDVVVRGEHRGLPDPRCGHRLRHLPDGPLSRSPAARREPGRGLLHRVSGRVADHHRLRPDHRRIVFLPDVRAPGLLPHHGPRGGDQHAVHHRRGADPGAGPADTGQPVRALRPQATASRAVVPSDRGQRRALAGAHPGRQHGRRPDRCDLRAHLRRQLRRPGLSTPDRGGESGLPGLGSTLLPEQAVHRDDDGRVRPRHAQLRGLHLPRPRGEGTRTTARGRDGAERDPAAGSTAGSREHPLPVHRAGWCLRTAIAVQSAQQRQHRLPGPDSGPDGGHFSARPST